MTSGSEPDMLERYARESEPTGAEIAALRTRLAPRLALGRVSTQLLAELPPPSDLEVAALRARVRVARREKATRRPPLWLALPLLGSAALAAAMYYGLSDSTPALPAASPNGAVEADQAPNGGASPSGDAAPRAAASPSADVAAAQGSVSATAERLPGQYDTVLTDGGAHIAFERFRLVSDGSGHLGGDPMKPVIDWRIGDLQLTVDPQKVESFDVLTREAHITGLVGTVEVVRSARGTELLATRGAARVECIGGATFEVAEGESAKCDELSVAALLGRAKLMRLRGVAAESILPVVELGLARGTSDALVESELVAMNAELLQLQGRWDGALAAANRYLASQQTPRRIDMLKIAAAATKRAGGCEAARPYIEQLESAGAVGFDVLNECEAVLQGSP